MPGGLHNISEIMHICNNCKGMVFQNSLFIKNMVLAKIYAIKGKVFTKFNPIEGMIYVSTPYESV